MKKSNNRSPLQVSPEFKKRLDEIQRKIRMAKGENRSLSAITKDIVSSPMFNEIERAIVKSGEIKMDIKIKLDTRRAFQ